MTPRPARFAGVLGSWLVALAACQGHSRDAQPAPPPAGSAAPRDAAPPPDADLAGCRQAAARAATLPPTARAQALIDGCRPCGDWQPLLTWNTLETDGGPSRAAIEQAMIACGAFCTPDAKQRFLGTLDSARGQATRMPWRRLGEVCKAAVSALPDARFMGGPYFALDRIARALGDSGAAIAIPLPALSLTGVGIDLPRADGVAQPADAPVAGPALTVDAGQFLLGALLQARLSGHGLDVTGDYPGAPIAPAALASALGAPGASATADPPVRVIAPHGLAASRIADAVAAAHGHPLQLAAGVPGPGGWSVPAAIPVVLRGTGAARGTGVRIALPAADAAAISAALAGPPRGRVTIVIDRAATVADLAHVLTALAGHGVAEVDLAVDLAVGHATKRPAGKP